MYMYVYIYIPAQHSMHSVDTEKRTHWENHWPLFRPFQDFFVASCTFSITKLQCTHELRTQGVIWDDQQQEVFLKSTAVTSQLLQLLHPDIPKPVFLRMQVTQLGFYMGSCQDFGGLCDKHSNVEMPSHQSLFISSIVEHIHISEHINLTKLQY